MASRAREVVVGDLLQVCIQLPSDQLARIDRVRAAEQRVLSPALRITRTATIRLLLEEALQARERDGEGEVAP